MAKIHVGRTRLARRSLQDAIGAAGPGDELLIHEGEHRMDAASLNGLHLTGVGDPEQIVIEARLDVWGESRISGLTLRAPHFHNAIYLRDGRARVDLTRTTVHGDPAGKYPAIYGDGGTLVMNTSAVRAPSGVRSIRLTKKGYLHAVESEVARLCLEGGRAVLAGVGAVTIEGYRGAKIESYGRLEVRPPEGRRFLILSGESVCTAPELGLANTPCEAYCEDSFLQLDAVETPDDETLRVITKGHAVVESTSDAVRVHDPDARPAAPPGPKVVPWHLADARSFSTAVAPHLRAGDTVELAEGEYFLDDCADSSLGIDVNLVGTGAAERTVIHGQLRVLDGHDVTLSNLTVRAPTEGNGVVNRVGRSLSMRDVIVEPTGTEYPPVFLSGGTTTMHGCVVAASTDSRSGVLTVMDGARLAATESSVGWLWVNNQSTVDLSHCASVQLWALGGSTVTTRGSHLIDANESGQRQVVAEGESTVSVEAITTNASHFEAYASNSTLDIGWVETPEAGSATIFVQEDARAQVEGSAVTVTDLDAVPESTAQAPTGQAPRATDDDHSVPVPPTVERPRDDAADDLPHAVAESDEEGAQPDDPLAEIEALTGLSTVKQQIRKFTRMVQYNQLRAQQGKPTTNMVMHSLFLGNPGTGKTTVARLLGEALFQAGAIANPTMVEVPHPRAGLVGDTIGSSAKLTTAVLERARGGMLFIDEAYTLYKPNNNEFAEEAVDTILAFIENHRDEIMVVFAGYGEQMQDLLGMNPGLRSRVTNRFDFEDYTPAEVAEIGYQELLRGDHTVNEELYRRVVATEYARSSDRSNGRWVRNFNQELVAVLAERVVDTAADDISHITDEDLHTLVGGDSEDKDERVQALLDELDAMIGLAPVKEWVRRLVNRVKVDRRRMERDGTTSRPTYHMVFAGNPGTGKTTVARIVAELFHNLGILRTPTVKEVDRAKLIGQFIGDTERITTKAVDEAMGGVLFVDEAYDLHVEDNSRDFGSKAIATLLPRLENDRDKFVAIFAGYSQQMEGFLTANPGLRSRVPQWIEFPDYTPEEVAQIVVARLSQHWVFDADHVTRVVVRAYAGAPVKEQSNGRWARNFVEDLEAEQNEYVATHDVPDADLDRIPAEVVDAVATARDG